MATTGSDDGIGEALREVDKPPSYLGSSVAVTLLCCLPFGLVAIVYGLQVETRWSKGDERGAMHASDMAEKWMYSSVGAFVLVAIPTLIWWIFWGRHGNSGLRR